MRIFAIRHFSIPLLVFSCLIFSCFYNISYSQTRAGGDIKGFVKDAKTGEALPFASVMIKGTKHGVSTNTNGYFVLVNIPADSLTLTVNYIGYNAQEIKLLNKPEGLPLLVVKMQPAVIQLDGVTVTANSMILSPAEQISQISISPQQLSSLPSIGEVDVFRSLQLLPGINAGNDGSSELYVRGGTPDQNLILFDGMTIYHVDHFFGFFSAFNADAIKDIQVYKGGFPAEYGGRLSSVLSLTGKTGNENEMKIGLGLNLLSAHAIFETPLPIFNKSTFLFAVRRSYTDFIQSGLYDDIYKTVTGEDAGGSAGRTTRPSGGPVQGGRFSSQVVPSFYFYDLNSKLTFSPGKNDIVSLSVYSGKDDLDKSQDYGNTSFMFRETGGSVNISVSDYTKWGNIGTSGKWSRNWHDRFQTEFLIAYSKYYSDYNRNSGFNAMYTPSRDSVSIQRGMANATKENNYVQDMSYKLTANWQISNSHTLSFGLWASQFESEFKSSMNDTTELMNRYSSAYQNSLFIQDQWKVMDNVELNFGLRNTYYEKSDKAYFEPRFSLSYEFLKGLKLKGAWGHYYQFVNRITNENVLEGSRDFWMLADENLKPSFAEHQIIGFTYENDSYYLSLEGYNKNLENLVEFTRRFARGADYMNRFFFGTGRARGVELLIQKKFGALTGWAGYSLSNVEYTFPGINDGQPFPAEHDHKHDIKLVGKFTEGTWTFAATWVFATGNAYTAPESQYSIKLLNGEALSYIHVSGKNANRLPDFHRLDISASKKFESDWAAIEIGASIFNLYNRKNVSYREYNLQTVPITITDVVQLGFMPTVFIQFNFK